MTSDTVPFGRADVTNCAREQIHIPGSIQPHGCLLALEPDDLRVWQGGGPTDRFLGVALEDLLGGSLGAVIGAELTARIKAAAVTGDGILRLPPAAFSADSGAPVLDAVVHVSDDLLLLELEPGDPDGHFPQDTFQLVQTLLGRVCKAPTVRAFCEEMASAVQDVSGFDRVMVYRFLADDSGAVESEALAPGMTSYIGLRYPASDIPAQARALYLRNTLRLIPDAAYRPSPLLAARGWPDGKMADLSPCALRSVSPLHLEYLANMGVAASMSISIVVEGRLWGLIACHHRSPRHLPSRIRAALDLFGQIASFQLETKLAAEDLSYRVRSATAEQQIVLKVSGDDDLTASLHTLRENLLNFIPSSGLAMWVDGGFAVAGDAPPKAEVMHLIAWLTASVADGVFFTDALSEVYPKAGTFIAKAAGVLAISVSRTPRDYVIWFRPELVQSVRWAGDPNKPVLAGPDGDRLSPRKSFADWIETVRGRSDPWTAADVKIATSLRVSLLEVVLEHVDRLARERQDARVRQDVLLAELDRKIEQWERTAEQLKLESDRRSVLEGELSQVLRRTVVEQEAERQRIARELHDSLGQYFTALQLDLDGIAREASASPTILAKVDHLKTLTLDAGQVVHTMAWELRPTSLDDLGLQTAIQQFLEQWAERGHLAFDQHLAIENRRFAPAVESALYRVLQEAVRNVVKHADATRVGVILEGTPTELRLIVEDDGKGFDLDSQRSPLTPSSRLGLLGMREHLALVGGRIEIETAPGRGTTLLIHVPI
jgi:light-regulated signal transduction histidine kinase (bacteriophytochrome)